MVSAALLSVLMATAASAAPYITERNLNSTQWTPSHKLASDEVILYGNGRSMSPPCISPLSKSASNHP